MNNVQFEVDAEQVMKMFSEFDQKQRKQVFRTAMNKALGIVKKQTLANLRSVIEPDKIDYKDEWGNSFKNGITTKVYRNNKSGVIHIMKNFKMRFFELGTKVRYAETWRGKKLKKERKTGQIKAHHFFSNAKKQTETQVFDSIEKLLTDSIRRINNKYKGKK